MSEAPNEPRKDRGESRPAPDQILSTPVYLQNGERASIERAFELAFALDHLKREQPAVLEALRLACVTAEPVRAAPAELAALHAMELTAEGGLVEAAARPLVLAMVRGASGEEAVENPFLDYSSRALFDYLRHGAHVSVLYDPREVKAVHENETVTGLMDAAPDASWVGYVRKGPPPGKGLPPTRN